MKVNKERVHIFYGFTASIVAEWSGRFSIIGIRQVLISSFALSLRTGSGAANVGGSFERVGKVA